MKKIVVTALIMSMIVGLCACGRSEETQPAKETEHIEIDNVDNANNINIDKENELDNDALEADVETQDEEIEVDFEAFAGEYCFSSGAGAWQTSVTIHEDGSFDGEYSDMDMGDMSDEYPNGTMYMCRFTGRFEAPEEVDEYTYTTKLVEIQTQNEVGIEEISDGMRIIYSDPYGFMDPDVFEFYLPGKKTASLSEDYISWTGLRFWSIFPAQMPSKGFYNVGGGSGFEEIGEASIARGVIPESKEVEVFELAGSYKPEFENELNISIYTDPDTGDEVGCFTWRNADNDVYQDEGYVYKTDKGYELRAEYSEGVQVVITDNTSGHIVFHVYTSNGFDCGEFAMTSHF